MLHFRYFLFVLVLERAVAGAVDVTNAPSEVIKFNKETSKTEIFGSPIKKQIVFFTDENESHHDTAMEMFNSLASEFKGSLLIIHIPFSETDFVNHFHVAASNLPQLFAIDMTNGMKKIPYGGNVLDAELTHGFIKAFANEELHLETDL